MKTYFLLFSMILLSLGMSAQSLHGTVVDSSNHQPIAGAVVFIPQLKLAATTDSTGYFNISTIPKGIYEIEVEVLGYATITQQVTIKG